MSVATILAAVVAATPAPAAGPAQSGSAADQSAPGVIAYPPSFFAEARANNAFEMLQRLPGFTFSGGENVRGFAGAGGNVLIDGERPATKSVSLDALLRRIPADFVERIELVRGGAPGIDMQGQPVVANVVRSRRAASSMAASVGARQYPGSTEPYLQGEWSRRSADFSLEAAALLEDERDRTKGDLSISAPGGARLASGPYRSEFGERFMQGSIGAELRRPTDVFRLNLGAERRKNQGSELQSLTSTTGQVVRSDVVDGTSVEEQWEIGLDWTRDFNDRASGRLIGLHRRDGQTSDETALSPFGVETSSEEDRGRESILRGVLTYRHSPALSFEGGGEAVHNVLQARTSVTDNGRPVVIPNANVRVTEKRAEGFVTAFWKPTPALSLEGGVRIETSTIAQRGDTNASESFFFPKPRLLLTWDFAPDWQLRLRAEREVGQLDFGDFTASSEFSTGTVNAGGADLRPERAWVAEAGIERRFWGEGAVVLTARHFEIQEVIDLVPVNGRFDATGNIGDGSRQELSAVLSLPLDRLGVSGGLLTGEGTWRRSSVRDPVTGADRRISGEAPLEAEVSFVQDIARLKSTWGVNLEMESRERTYRISEERLAVTRLQWEIFWDWKPRDDLSIRAAVEQTGFGRTHELVRTRFAGPRSAGVVREIERRNIKYDPAVFVRVRKAW